MFNNPFLKKDPLLEAVKNAQAEGEMRRQAEAIVNEEFGVYSRKAVVREDLAAYDAALEDIYEALKGDQYKIDLDKNGKLNKKDFDMLHARKKHMEEGKATRPNTTNTPADKGSRAAANDGNLANNYPPYDKVTRGDVIAGATGKDQMGGKKKVNEKKMWEDEDARAILRDMQSKDKNIQDRDARDQEALVRAAKDVKSVQEGSAMDPKDPSVQGSGDVTSTPAPKPQVKKAPDDPSVQGSGDVTSGGKPARIREETLEEAKKRWIQDAIKKKGALSKQLGVPEKENIPAGKLAAAAEKGGKLGKRARLAQTLKRLRKEETDSFKSAQVTGKSVDEAVDVPTPSWVNQPAPGVQRAARPGVQRLQGNKFFRGIKSSTSGPGTAKFLPTQTAKASAPPPKTGTALTTRGNTLPAASAGGNKLPVPRSSGAVTTTQQPLKTTYTKTEIPGVNPPHPSEKIGGFTGFKPAAAGGGARAGLGALGRSVGGIGGAVAAAAAPYVAAAMKQSHEKGHASFVQHKDTPGVSASDSFARMRQMKAPAAPAAPAAPKPAAATTPGDASKMTPTTSKSGFYKGGSMGDRTVKKGETLSGIAKSTGQNVADLAKMNKISDVNKISTGAKLMTKVPTPPSRPTDIASATSTAAATQTKAASPMTSASSVKQQFGSSADLQKDIDTAKSSQNKSQPTIRPTSSDSSQSSPIGLKPGNPEDKFRLPKSMTGGAYQQVAPSYKPLDMPDELKTSSPSVPKQSEAPTPAPSTPASPPTTTPKKQNVQESVQIGANKYRIV